jgi:ElaB/YqjD/DUF883 family membrane-anchored ribosome-binding protein
MDQRTRHTQRYIEDRQAVMTEARGTVEHQVQEAAEQIKSTVDHALGSFTQVPATVDQAKATVEETLESIKGTVHETFERVKPVADLLDHVQQNAWRMLGSAILLGYILGSFAREHTSAR